ncbi:Single hybrid motif [Venustampulla echinocandica]|uniref:Single hybrid motif n=1 Tax=Venustampulla echinocandica TaxID=2656787 RepID=A0A370TY90_9HELO|nr:Single hybrid motif [Venustampulla echinocandica]RDL40483.1 Single hybrid motif [Venustampulla echinocandica]
MPALSPTMTEGNIASWKVKEGDAFSAGDVLLEIETDKASMDVEAQDDGVMAKIFQGDGAKGIKVGARIGVLAEPGDDISSLEIPAEDNGDAPAPKEEASKPAQETKPQAEAPPTSKPSSPASGNRPAKSASKPAAKQTYPLLPSVQHLIHEKGLSEADIDKMTPTGPNNRLLKGDVLAYLGSISPSYPTELSEKILKLSHLDLSNIKLAPPAPAPTKKSEPMPEPVIEDREVAIPISLTSVIEVQRRVQKSLGIFLPLSTFIARATDFANDDLPRSKNYRPSADELFNQVLGLDKVTSESGARGNFFPQITALSEAAPVARPAKAAAKGADILDILSGKAKPVPSSSVAAKQSADVSAAVNVFSVTVPKGDEKRAHIFLDRVKAVLEGEPGRLIL